MRQKKEGLVKDRSHAKKRLRRLGALVAIISGMLVLVGGVTNAKAHWLTNSSGQPLHWHVGGSAVYIGTYNWASTYGVQAERARANIESWNHPVYLPRYNYNTNIEIYDTYFTYPNWCGWGGGNYTGNHWTHTWAYFNRNCAGSGSLWIQGIYCQEISHALGLQHSNTGECMGLSYFSNTTYYFGTHPTTDLTNMHLYH